MRGQNFYPLITCMIATVTFGIKPIFQDIKLYLESPQILSTTFKCKY